MLELEIVEVGICITENEMHDIEGLGKICRSGEVIDVVNVFQDILETGRKNL